MGEECRGEMDVGPDTDMCHNYSVTKCFSLYISYKTTFFKKIIMKPFIMVFKYNLHRKAKN